MFNQLNNRRWLMCVALLFIAGCGRDPAASTPLTSTPHGWLAFGAPVVLTGPETKFATVMTAASATGERAYAWTASPPGEGTLTVWTEAAGQVVVPEADGAAGLDPESSAKIAYGPTGEIYVAYSVTQRAVSEPGTSFRVIRSSDHGKSWSAPHDIADDGPWGAYRNDHAFHAGANGTLYAAWLDGRQPNNTRLYFSRSLDKGATWSRNLAVDTESPCECCRIALAAAAPDSVYMAWRKILPGGIRDIVVARSVDGGASWSKAVLTHADDWKIDGCPDAGPSLLAEPTGRLHMVWWTGKEGAAGVKYVASGDGGTTWGDPLTLKVGAASRPSHAQIARGADGTLYVAWDDGISKDPQIVLAVSHDGGRHFGAPQVLSEPGASAVFPALAVTKNSLTVVWHQPNPKRVGEHQVIARTAKLT